MPSNYPLLTKVRRASPRRINQWSRGRLKRLAARAGYRVERIDEENRRYLTVSHNDEVPLPPGAADELRSDNPRLLALQADYEGFDSPATSHTQWGSSFLRRNLSMAWFRGDNAYVWQFRLLRTAANSRMYLSLLDVESRDRVGLLKHVREDGLFGAFQFSFGDRHPVSRDLLDSVNEINYLDARMGLSQIEDLRVLDIGAGYGRLAHRMSESLPNLSAYDCIDGVAVSTFLCEYYTRFRGLEKVRTIPLTQHETLAGPYDLCVNIHSWAECSLATIQWWLDRVAELDIPWLLIVPNMPPQLLSTEADGAKLSFHQDVLDRGYELVDDRPMIESDELRELVDQHGRFYLFRRTTA
jgi:putative sugar O-methyltransferase